MEYVISGQYSLQYVVQIVSFGQYIPASIIRKSYGDG